MITQTAKNWLYLWNLKCISTFSNLKVMYSLHDQGLQLLPSLYCLTNFFLPSHPSWVLNYFFLYYNLDLHLSLCFFKYLFAWTVFQFGSVQANCFCSSVQFGSFGHPWPFGKQQKDTLNECPVSKKSKRDKEGLARQMEYMVLWTEAWRVAWTLHVVPCNKEF